LSGSKVFFSYTQRGRSGFEASTLTGLPTLLSISSAVLPTT
jgi:hypothetical protein